MRIHKHKKNTLKPQACSIQGHIDWPSTKNYIKSSKWSIKRADNTYSVENLRHIRRTKR